MENCSPCTAWNKACDFSRGIPIFILKTNQYLGEIGFLDGKTARAIRTPLRTLFLAIPRTWKLIHHPDAETTKLNGCRGTQIALVIIRIGDPSLLLELECEDTA